LTPAMPAWRRSAARRGRAVNKKHWLRAATTAHEPNRRRRKEAGRVAPGAAAARLSDQAATSQW
jgi:hypothetical protein